MMLKRSCIPSSESLDAKKIAGLLTRGGVLKDVLGLEDTFSSPWPWPRSLKTLASKPQVLENCPVLGSRTALFFEPLKFR